MKGIFKLLKNKIFIRYFSANILAYIGTNMGLLGINWHLVAITGSNQILSTYSAITVLTTIISSLFIGGIVDNHNKSILMKLNNILQGIMILFVFWLLTIKNISFYVIYFMAVINSFGHALFVTASKGILQDIITNTEDLIHGNSINEICLQIGAIIASCLTGVLYAIWGFSLLIVIMVVSLFLSGFAMKYIKKSNAEKNKIKEKIKFSELFLNKKIVIIGFLAFLPYVVTLLSNNVLPGYVNEYLQSSSSVYGIADMMYGIGALIAGFIVSSNFNFKKINKEVALFFFSIISLFILTFNKNILILFFCYFFFGLSNTGLKICLNTLFMKTVPNEIYGKSYSFMNSVVSTLQIVMLLLIGKVLDLYGAAVGYLILSTIMFLGAIIYSSIKKQLINLNYLKRER
ncbi:MFS transporter [Eubacterium limosum]|uniref:MFS transporter n=1 Tax=Eubacterium limosum TaxID=1736 RepID=UPI001063318B|nr:MFS transporter [Eubacterium limosum]